MACIQSIPTFGQECSPRMGGIRAIYVALRSDVVDIGSNEPFVLSLDFNSIYRIPCRGSFSTVEQVDDTTGASYYLDTLEVTPVKQVADYEIPNLAQIAAAAPDDLVILIESWNSDYMFCLGYGFTGPSGGDLSEVAEFPVFRGGSQWVTGSEKTDANGASFTLTSVHPFPAALAAIADTSSIANPSTD